MIVDRLQFFTLPPSVREKVRGDEGKSGSSILPQRERDLRKWRCRRLGLAEGSPSRNTHTCTEEE